MPGRHAGTSGPGDPARRTERQARSGPPRKTVMHISAYRAPAKPAPITHATTTERPAAMPRRPDQPGLTREELRQIVLDLLG